MPRDSIRALFISVLALVAVPTAAAGRPVVVDLVARDDSNPNGFSFRGDGCSAVSTYSFAVPPRARSPRLFEDFKPGLALDGPYAAGYGGDGGRPYIARYARVTRIVRRQRGDVAVFDFEVMAERESCAGYADARNGAFVPGWITGPVQVFGYYRLRVPALYTVDVAGTRRDGPPRRFAIGRGRVATGLRWRDWARQEASGRGRVGRRPVTIKVYNPEFCRGRVFYEDYAVTIGGRQTLYDLTGNCRRLTGG